MTKFLEDLEATPMPMELVHPTKGPLGIALHVAGPDSPEFRETRTALMQKRIATGMKDVVDIAAIAEETNQLLAACITGWDDVEKLGEYSKEAALALVSNPKLSWIREQLNEFTDERKNFFR